jgi:1-acyl-sn-glycerol-3-phosphate acyltransferase
VIQLRSLVFQVLFLSWTALVSIFFSPLLWAPKPKRVRIAALWCRGTMWFLRRIVGLTYEVVGRENCPATPAIYAFKHQSAWETIAVCGLFPNFCIVLKQELMRIPMFGMHLRRMGFIGIDRSAGASALKEMVRAARDVHAEGRDIVMFPEGTRTPPGERQPYHPGIAALYRDLKVPVVPVALNSGLFWGRRKLFKRPGCITVRFLPPIEPGLQRPAFMASLEDSIETATDALVEGAGATGGATPKELSTA